MKIRLIFSKFAGESGVDELALKTSPVMTNKSKFRGEGRGEKLFLTCAVAHTSFCLKEKGTFWVSCEEISNLLPPFDKGDSLFEKKTQIRLRRREGCRTYVSTCSGNNNAEMQLAFSVFGKPEQFNSLSSNIFFVL